MIWQQHFEDEWVFGEMIRGMVRRPYFAEVYFDEDRDPGWVWYTTLSEGVSGPRGQANTLDDAITICENVLRETGLEF